MTTAMLGQQELLEPRPTRRLIVPVGYSAWWGVDPSTVRVAIAGVEPIFDGRGFHRWTRTQSFATLDNAARLSEIYAVTRKFVTGLATCCTWPGIVVVEQPSGEKRNWPLYYAVGATITAVHDGLRDVCGRSVKVETIPPASWKKSACGRGDIYKPKRNEREYGVLTWAKQNGYEGSSWDEADAMGIAEAARRTVALEQR